jgi:hypothetical protein
MLKGVKDDKSENHPLNVTDELITDIEAFLENEGIKISWNNTYSTFWESI